MSSDNASAAVLSGKSKEYVLLVELTSGKLSLPGGRRERGEGDFEAMRREWEEETGIGRLRKDQVDLSKKYVHVHKNGTTTAIFYGQTKRHYTWYIFNRDRLLKPGETRGLVWMKVSDAIRDPRLKSYCEKSLKAMKGASLF